MASNLCPLQPSRLSPLHCLKLVNYNLRCACPPCSLAISASFDNTLWLGLVTLSSLSSHSLKWRLSEFIQLLYITLWAFAHNPVQAALYPCSRQKVKKKCEYFLLGRIWGPNASRSLLKICSKSTFDWIMDERLSDSDDNLILFMKMERESGQWLVSKHPHKMF